MATSYDFVVVDGAAKLEDIIATAVKSADLVDLIKTRQSITEGKPKAAFIISRTIDRTRLGRGNSRHARRVSTSCP